MGMKKGERFFKTDCITVKKIDGGEIIFYDRQSIYLYQDGFQYGTIFNNWNNSLGSYGSGWKQFRKRLWQYKTLSVRRCYELALEFDILAFVSYDRLDLTGKKVRTINE